jgi:hypothetical protein
MGAVLVEIISQFGVLGLILAGIIYLIVDALKNKKKNLVSSKKLDESIDKLEGHVDKKIDDVNTRIDLVNDKVDTQYELLNKRIDAGPEAFMDKMAERKKEDDKEHFNKIIEQFTQAPKLHRILKLYRERIGCDHIFFGTFHNGSTSISGIPYCKFDIVAEKFKPGRNNMDLREYTTIYKNSDIIVHDNLPMVISQEDYVYFKIQEDGSSELEEIDDILYRRCIKNGVKQFALNLLRDGQMNPIGFVGCVDFNYDDDLNFQELNNCAKELEEIYK